MHNKIQYREAADVLQSNFGSMSIEKGLYKSRSVTAEAFSDAVSAAHQKAWQEGVGGFVYTRANAVADGVV